MLQHAKTWTSEEIFKGLFNSQKAFETAKGMGVVRETLMKFLGGNWTAFKVQSALAKYATWEGNMAEGFFSHIIPNGDRSSILRAQDASKSYFIRLTSWRRRI